MNAGSCLTRCFRPLLFLGLAGLLGSGCATARLDTARGQFFAGRPQEAAATLNDTSDTGKDRVLVLMERGSMRQEATDYEGSSKDFIAAYDEIERMTAIQVGQDSASMVINDNVQDYRGAPYERTMLHVFTAFNHLAAGHWENAAVEARRIIKSLSPEVKGDYPDDAFSRYMAGFCLERVDDFSNAALQYRNANEVAQHALVDERTGRLAPKGAESNVAVQVDSGPWPHELVCFVMLGRVPPGDMAWKQGMPHPGAFYAEIQSQGKTLGRSYCLADTAELAFTTKQKEAAKVLAKTAARIAVKESIAHQFDQNDEAIGEIVRFILISLLEQPDVRRWQTLPRFLHVARVPCPPDLQEFDVVVKNSFGQPLRTMRVTAPISRHRNTRVSFVRDTSMVY